MTWNLFIVFAVSALLLWTVGAWAAWKDKRRVAYVTTAVGLAVFFAFIVGLWVSLERPPLRTMGETRLWYSLFLPMAGLLVYSRWKYKWILSFSTLLAAVFIVINLLKPEIHNKTLMPALQSPWFAPHVIVYMMAYALLGAAFVMSVFMLWKAKSDKSVISEGMNICDNLVYTGWSFLTIGMLFGALWAKEAWGTYWAWDPQRDMGCRHMARLPGLYPPSSAPKGLEAIRPVGARGQLRPVADVLVGHQLPAIGQEQQCAYV